MTAACHGLVCYLNSTLNLDLSIHAMLVLVLLCKFSYYNRSEFNFVFCKRSQSFPKKCQSFLFQHFLKINLNTVDLQLSLRSMHLLL